MAPPPVCPSRRASGPGMEKRPLFGRDDFISALAFAVHPAIAAGVREAGMPAMISKAQDIVAGSDPTLRSLQQLAEAKDTPPELGQQYRARAARMQADAAQFLKDNGAPQ